MCTAHYSQWRAGKDLTPIRPQPKKGQRLFESCGRTAAARKLCMGHYGQWKAGRELTPIKLRNYDGQERVNSHGYRQVRVPGHPNASKSGWVLEHVAVMSEMIGRPLVKGENVHHLNGVRSDNRPENLELWVIHQPAGQRAGDLLAWAYEIINCYEKVGA